MVNERLKEMAEFIRLHQTVTLSALQKKFPDVSSMTLRRDLIKLEDAGLIVRIKGGARSLSAFADIYNKEDSFSKRIHQNVEQKAEIAQKAKKLIGSERSLYLDPGTTVLHLANCLPKSGLFLCTNGPNIALELLKHTNCDVFLVGGQLGRENVCVAGPTAMEYIKDVNIELAFFAASGVICPASLNKLLGIFEINFASLTLAIWCVRTTYAHTLVNLYTTPFERLDDILLGSWHETL